MRRLELRREGWTALAALLLVVVGGGGIAAAASTVGTKHTVERSVLTAAGVTDAEGAPQPTSSTTTAPPTTAPATTTTAAPRNATTTVPAKAPVTTTATATVRPSSGAPATTAPPATATTSIPANPSSWSVDQDGISVRVRIDPAVPRAGQSVRFIIDTSTTTGNYCCANMLTVNGVQEPLPKGGPTVDANGAPITSTHEEQTWTVPESGRLNVRLDATSLGGPPLSATQPAQPVWVTLTGSTPILP